MYLFSPSLSLSLSVSFSSRNPSVSLFLSHSSSSSLLTSAIFARARARARPRFGASDLKEEPSTRRSKGKHDDDPPCSILSRDDNAEPRPGPLSTPVLGDHFHPSDLSATLLFSLSLPRCSPLSLLSPVSSSPFRRCKVNARRVTTPSPTPFGFSKLDAVSRLAGRRFIADTK